jgi:hypothetical protein
LQRIGKLRSVDNPTELPVLGSLGLDLHSVEVPICRVPTPKCGLQAITKMILGRKTARHLQPTKVHPKMLVVGWRSTEGNAKILTTTMR